jgi:hypothetical protein
MSIAGNAREQGPERKEKGYQTKKGKRDQKTQGKRGPRDWNIRVEGGGGGEGVMGCKRDGETGISTFGGLAAGRRFHAGPARAHAPMRTHTTYWAPLQLVD